MYVCFWTIQSPLFVYKWSGCSFEKISSVRLVKGIIPDLPLDPFLGTLESIHHGISLLSQQIVPVCFALQNFCIADNDEPMLGPSDTNIDPILLLHEASGAGPHHRHENQIELSTLRAVNREHLIFNTFISEILSNRIFLRVVRCYDVDTVLCELLYHELVVLFVQLN